MKEENRFHELLVGLKRILGDREEKREEEWRYWIDNKGEENPLVDNRYKNRIAYIDGETIGRIEILLRHRYFRE